MDLHVTQYSTPDGVRRALDLTSIPGHQKAHIFFDLVGEESIPEPMMLDGFVFGVVFYAMRLGQPLRVNGPMSRQALLNLNEFQEAWVSWLPDVYKKVEISTSEILDVPHRRSAPRPICAYSGGVDSTFTVLRHKKHFLGNASYPIEAGLLVHGFDVLLSEPQHLEGLKKRVAPLFEELGVRLKIIRTNLNELALMDWEPTHAAQLACCLHNYSHEYDIALIASTEPYTKPVLGWGSSPMTDYLMTGDAMRIVHDGAGYSRTEKVALLAKNDAAMKVLKVCWEGTDASKNCGVCEKCIRTQANFLAVGVTHAPCFDKPFDTKQIETMNLRNEVQCGEMASIYNYTRKHGITGEWIHMVKGRIDRYRHPPGNFSKLRSVIVRGKFSAIIGKMWWMITRRITRNCAPGAHGQG
jgi:hypothetical protein